MIIKEITFIKDGKWPNKKHVKSSYLLSTVHDWLMETGLVTKETFSSHARVFVENRRWWRRKRTRYKKVTEGYCKNT